MLELTSHLAGSEFRFCVGRKGIPAVVILGQRKSQDSPTARNQAGIESLRGKARELCSDVNRTGAFN